MNEAKLIRVIKHAKRYPDLQPHLFERVIELKGKKSLSFLYDNGMFTIEDLKEQEMNETKKWKTLDFFPMYFNRFHTEDSEYLDRFRSVFKRIVSSDSFNQMMAKQILRTYNYIPSSNINYDDYDLMTSLLEKIEPSHELAFSLYFNIFQKLKKSEVKRDFFLLLFKYHGDYSDYLGRNEILEHLINGKILNEVMSIENMEEEDSLYKELLSLLSNYLDNTNNKKDFSISGGKIKIDGKKYFLFGEKDQKITSISIENYEKDIANLIDVLEENCISNIEKKEMRDLYCNIFSLYSYYSIWENNTPISSYHDYLLVALKYMLKNEKNYDLVLEMLKDSYFLIKKLAIFMIIEQFEDYKEIVIKGIKERDNVWELILSSYIFGDETVKLFNKISGDKSCREDSELIDSIAKIIDQGPFLVRHRGENYEDFFKQSRYRELKCIENFNVLYKKLYSKTGLDYQLGAAISFSGPYWIEQIFPISYEELISMDSKNIVKEFNQFNPSNYKSPSKKEYSYRGGQDILKKFTKDFPYKIINNMNDYLEIEPIYVHSIFEGFEEYWQNKQDKLELELAPIIQFAYDYLSKISVDDLERLNDKKAYPYRLINSIMRFFERSSGLDVSNYRSFISIVKLIQEKKYYSMDDDTGYFENKYKELSSNAINKVWGVTMSAILATSLEVNKVNKDKGSKLWRDRMRPLLEKLVNDNNKYVFYYTGKYIPNFNYIDNTWNEYVYERAKDKSEVYDENFISYMIGYSECRNVSDNVIGNLIEDIEKVIKMNEIDVGIKKELAYRVALAYIYGKNDYFANIKNVLDTKINACYESIIYAIKILEINNDKEYDLIKSRVIKLWEEMLQNNNISNNILSLIFDLLEPIRWIDRDVSELITKTLNLIGNLLEDKSFNYIRYYSLTKKIDKIVKENDKNYKDLVVKYLAVLTPDFKFDEVKRAIDFIAKHNKQRLEEVLESYIVSNNNRKIIEYIIKTKNKKYDS